MPLVPDMAALQRKLGGFPLVTYQAGETVLTAGLMTGRLLILKQGAVEVIKEGIQIAKVMEPGAVFGELSVLLDQPHTADVRALEVSQFHAADAATLHRRRFFYPTARTHTRRACLMEQFERVSRFRS